MLRAVNPGVKHQSSSSSIIPVPEPTQKSRQCSERVTCVTNDKPVSSQKTPLVSRLYLWVSVLFSDNGSQQLNPRAAATNQPAPERSRSSPPRLGEEEYGSAWRPPPYALL